MIRLACIVLGLLLSFVSAAQNSFRSRQSGDWNQSSTWEEFIAGTWQLTGNTPSFTSGTISLQSPFVVTVTAAVTIDQTTVQPGATLTINDPIVVTLNQGLGTDLTSSGDLNLLGESFINGTGDIIVGGNLSLGSLSPTGALQSGTSAGNIRVSNRAYNSGTRIIYNGVAAQFIGSGHPPAASTGVDTEINNASGITFDTNTTGNPGGSMIIPGALIMTSGDIHIIATPGTGRALSLRGTITPNGNFITFAGPSSLRIEGSGTFGTFPFQAGSQSLYNFVLNRAGESVTFSNPLSFTGDVAVIAGTVNFGGTTSVTGSVAMGAVATIAFPGQSLTFGENFTSTGGVLSSDATSTLILTGIVAHTSAISFAGGSSLSTFTLNKNNVGTSATIGSPVTVVTALNLTDGILDNTGGNLTLTNGATLTKSSEGSIITSSPSGGPWNLVYTNASQSTGLEIPASGILTSLSVNTSNAAVVTLGQSIDISNNLTIPSVNRTFTSGANNVKVGGIFSNTGTFNAPTAAASTGLTLSGNFVNNGVFNHNNGTVVFNGTTVMSGTQITTTNFNTIDIDGTLTPSTTLNIQGNFNNDGTFVAGAGTVVFNGAVSTLSGTSINTTSFSAVTINPGATLVSSTNFILGGNLTVNGALTAGAGTTTFAGTSSLLGTSINTTSFNHIYINAGATLTGPVIFLVGGNFTNDGTFVAGSRNVTFNGTSVISGITINTTNFFDIIISGGASVTAPATLNVLGNFMNDGSFVAGLGTVVFSGNLGAKTLSGASNTQFFGLTMSKTNGGTSVTIGSPQTVTNSLNLLDGITANTSGNLSLSSGSTLTRAATGTITTASPSGGPWNLIYVGSASLSTALEIPASGILTSLTINVDITRQVTLTQSITVQNALTISSAGRTLVCSTNSVTTASVSNGGTISAPSSAAATGLRVSGNFANNGTFTHNNGLTTFNGTTNISGSTSTTFGGVTISGTLNPLVDFSVARNFTNNGTFNAGTSTITFNGVGTLQNIAGSVPVTTFQNLTITNTTNPVSVSIETNVNLIGVLTMGAAAKLDADGAAGTSFFVLLSTSDSPAIDASIAALPATAQVQGNVTVQRFFRPKDNFDRFISSPVSNGPVSQIQASSPAGSFPVTGEFTGTSFPCTGCTNNGDNLRYYREADVGVINKGYKGFIVSSNAETLVPGVGYDAFMWNGVSNTTVGFRGTINRGSIALGIVTTPATNSITHTSNGVADADGWNLVGNPYPSAIQWSNGAGWTRSNIDPTVWVWDVVGRVWHSYNANTSTGDLTNGVIASGQGFWVYAPAVGAASISVNEQVKSISGSGSYFRTASAGENQGRSKSLRISLTKGESTDNSFILVDPRASLGVDDGLDAAKLQLGIERVSISMISEGRKWGHMALGEQLPDVLPLSVSMEDAGSASIAFEIPDSYAALGGYYLVDTYMSQSVLVGSGKPYVFEIIAGDQSSQGERFYLSKYPLVEKTILSTLRLTAHPNPAVNVLHIELSTEQQTEIALLDYAGRPVLRINPVIADGMTRASVDVSQQPTGLYVLKVMVEGTLMTRKIVISH